KEPRARAVRKELRRRVAEELILKFWARLYPLPGSFPVLEETGDAQVGQRVLEQLPDDLGRRGHHVGADLGGFDHVHRVADAGDEDLRAEIVIVVDEA